MTRNIHSIHPDAPDPAEEERRASRGLPWCDTCKAPAIWSEHHGWLHTTADQPFGVYEHQDPADHRPTAREWWHA